MSGLSKRLEKIERAATSADMEPLDLRIAFVEALNGKPGSRSKGYTLAELVDPGAKGHEHEWLPYDGREDT